MSAVAGQATQGAVSAVAGQATQGAVSAVAGQAASGGGHPSGYCWPSAVCRDMLSGTNRPGMALWFNQRYFWFNCLVYRLLILPGIGKYEYILQCFL